MSLRSTANVRDELLTALNSIYTDIQLQGIDDTENLNNILDRISSAGWYHARIDGSMSKDAIIDVLSDALYIRSLITRIERDGYEITSTQDLYDAVEESGLEVQNDAELFQRMQYELQIAAEYQEYLENQSAYDSAILAAGSDSAYASGWALTFIEAARLGLTEGYAADGDEIDNVFITSSGNDSIVGQGGDDFISTYSGDDILHGQSGHDTLQGGSGADQLFGGTGDDLLIGGSGADTMFGGSGNDAISYQDANGGVVVDLTNASANAGDAAGDVIASGENLIGSSFDDVLVGDENNNSLIGGLGADTLDGGDGIDTVSYASSSAGVSLNLTTDGTAGLGGDADGDELFGIENLIGSDHADTLTGGHGANSLVGGTGNDSLYGRWGNDVIHGSVGNDVVSGGNDDDLLFGGTGDDALVGGNFDAGNDTLHGGLGADRLYGGEGLDMASYEGSTAGVTINLTEDGSTGIGGDAEGDTLLSIENLIGSDHSDHMTGGYGTNYVYGGLGNDSLWGRWGDDIVSGGAGNDRLDGGYDNDILYGGAGNDRLLGGADAGQDTLIGGTGADLLYGGNGVDTASYVNSSAGVTLNLTDDGMLGSGGEAEGDRLYSIENLIGSIHNDHLTGGYGTNLIEGGDGDDSLWGRWGDDRVLGGDGDDHIDGGFDNDILQGGAGNDRLIGGGDNGNDTMTGGLGADVFVFDVVFGNDAITDFESDEIGELIDFSRVDEFSSFLDLLSNHMVQSGASTVINDGLGNVVILQDIQMTDLSADNFLF